MKQFIHGFVILLYLLLDMSVCGNLAVGYKEVNLDV